MNGIDKIKARIESDAQSEIDRILGDAREEADRIAERYRAQAEAERESLEARNEKSAAEREERLVSVAQMESRKVTLAAKQEMVERVYELALKKLRSMPEDRYVEVLADLLAQAASHGKGEAIFSKEDQKAGAAAVEKANKATGGKLTISKETRPLNGGFVLKDGNVEVNCTFDTLVRLQKAETAGAVAKKLFPEA